MDTPDPHFRFIQSISDVSADEWDALAINQGVFMRHAFLLSLEQSLSVCQASGWQPYHLLAYNNEELVGIMPMYKKTHSYGEYVFDFAWADAYHQHQLEYYPKLISAIPFTPVSGARLIISAQIDKDSFISQLKAFLGSTLTIQQLSSFHLLFPVKQLSDAFSRVGMPQRLSVQFQWFNRNYSNFQAFLDTFTARRRKSVRKERQKIAQQEVRVERLCADQIAPADMQFFYQCYKQTYYKRSGHSGYLTESFFECLLNSMQQNLLLVIAHEHDRPIAAALYLFDQDTLFGRYWGAITEVDGLHFECCYYQGIEFCIERKLQAFNPGTQGEHKLLRGFEPILCYSNHFMAHPAFHRAVEDFIRHETPQIRAYQTNAKQLLPYRQQ